MYYKKGVVCIFMTVSISLLMCTRLSAQDKKFQPLRIGEMIPDILFDQVLNYDSSKVKISDFRGKLLILDFWSTWCSVCIASFPKMKSLQDKFGDRITVLPVGFERSEGEIEMFLDKRKATGWEMKLPTAIQSLKDTVLQNLFPFSGLPFEVWIDQHGALIGTTGHLAVNEDNIERILDGENIYFGIKKPRRILSPREEFLIRRKSHFQVYGSALSGYIDTLSSGGDMLKQLDSSFIRFYDINKTIFDYYEHAYQSQISDYSSIGFRKRIIVEPNNLNFYKSWHSTERSKDNWADDDFRRNNLFSYELILPKQFYDLQAAYKYMIEDLDGHFRLKSKLENRPLKYLAVVKKEGSETPNHLSDNYPQATSNENGDWITAKNVPFVVLISQLNNSVFESDSPLLIIDETGYDSKISYTLPRRVKDIEIIRKALNRYGFDLIEKTKTTGMIVLTRSQNK